MPSIIDPLTEFVAVLAALSMASERLVEILKGLVPSLNLENPDPRKEGMRKAAIQFLAVAAGIATAALAYPAVADVFKEPSAGTIFALGLLASGGSGFWNGILTYLKNLKDIRKAEVARLKGPDRGGGPATSANKA